MGPLAPKHPHDKASAPENNWNIKGKVGSNEASEILKYAGSLFLDGFGADGVVFFDAGSRRYINNNPEPTSETPSESASSSSASEDELPINGNKSPNSSQRSHHDVRFGPSACGVLACSMSRRHPRTISAPGHLREKDLQRLLRRYPRGKILHIEETGTFALSSSDDDGDRNTGHQHDALRARQKDQSLDTSDPSSILTNSGHYESQGGFENPNVQRSKSRLSKVFPKARSIAFFPLWDFHRERWYAGGFAYSCNVKRLIFSEEDLHFLRFFSLCIMGELAKRDWLSSELQKETFVSLISHELRTPLHGILSNCELLRDVGLTPFQTTLLDTVDGCGHSLLDIINHLLDHSTMVAKGEQQKRNKQYLQKSGRLHSGQNTGPEELSEGYGVHAQEDIDLVAVTEEIIGGLTSEMQLFEDTQQGYEKYDVLHSPRRQNLSRSHPVMIYAIHPRDNWVLRIRTGAFRRVLTNLVGNSIKFTKRGTIQVALRRDDPKDRSSVCTVTLRVTDTGEGISDDFLKHHLFERFQQENSHTVGNGLGLFIIRSIIVDELNGIVDVQSQKGNGTMVTVTFPCELVARSPPLEGSKPLQYLQNTLGNVKEAARGLTAYFIGTGFPNQESEKMRNLGFSMDSIAKICMEWFNLEIIHSETLASGKRCVNFVDESYLYSRSFSDMQDEIESSADRSNPRKPFYTPTIFIGAASFVAALHKDSAFRASNSQFFVTNP